MPAITGGAALLKALAATGTGESKLEAATVAVEKAVAAGVPMTAKDVVELMEADPHAAPHTLEKAKALLATGEYVPAPPVTELAGRLDRLVKAEEAAAKPAKANKA